MPNSQKPELKSDWIDPDAYGIVKSLQKKGFETYLVGGCVRDLLLGIAPKDFDIVTKAQPNDIKRSVYGSYIIGKRFRLVLVKRGEEQYEVATFRRTIREDEDPDELPSGDNLFGTPMEDANRRDFTINGLFYDPISGDLIDHTNGLDDLNNGIIRMIGTPKVRLIEDPIRILRAIRLAHKIRFAIEPELKQSICDCADHLADSALPRRREEYLKFLRTAEPHMPLLDCYDFGVLKIVAPTLHKIFDCEQKKDEFITHLYNFHTHNLDLESPLELFSGLLHAYVRTEVESDASVPLRSADLLENPALLKLMKEELGMFNYEQILFAKSIQHQSTLANVEAFSSRGERRKISFLKSESFPLALKMAHMDYSLSGEQSLEWAEMYKKYSPQIKELQKADSGKKKKKRRRRRPRNPLR